MEEQINGNYSIQNQDASNQVITGLSEKQADMLKNTCSSWLKNTLFPTQNNLFEVWEDVKEHMLSSR